MAVTKTVAASRIRDAYAAGLRLFGENRVQEFAAKVSALNSLEDAKWHMIGHLQSNKSAKAVELFSAVDSVDSLRLAERLNSSAEELGKQLPVLIEINAGGESAKNGFDPESEELFELLNAAARFPHLRIEGLMTVPPYADDPQQSRPYFRRLRQSRDRIADRNLPGIAMNVLSMGMSHDFEVAIEEGATCVRIGTEIFGRRAKP
jgi:pyridoxal phosphate enzyme (YggS family)